MSYLVAKYNVWQKQFEENKKQKNVPSISAVPKSLSQSFFWFCLSLSSNDQKSGTVIFVKKIQTLVVYPLSPSKKDGKIQAASKEAAGVDSVHSTTTHIYPLWQSLLIIASSSNFYSFSLYYYAIPTIPNQTSSNVGHCDSFPACLCGGCK